ncbi:MAG: cardiolipin synthase [Saprospiraceae bacterium]|jgi:cardiolipin synthase
MVWVFQVTSGFYVLFVFITLRHIFFNVKDSGKTFSWMLVVIFIPLIGVLLYRLIGISVKRDRFFKRAKIFDSSYNKPIDSSKIPQSKIPLATLLNRNHSSAISYRNNVDMLKNGKTSFEYVYKDIEQASNSIHLDFYIIETGIVLNKCLEILEKKCKEGVKVRLVYDAFGTEGDKESFKKLRKIGVEVRVFMPFNWFKYYMYLNYRNHRKIIIIDNKIAYTGGMNISDKNLDGDSNLGFWRDTYIRVEGDAAINFERVFYNDWRLSGGDKYALPEPKLSLNGNIPVQVIASGPDSDHCGIMQEYFTLITDAIDYIYISSPYFIPGEAIMTALKTSALSGVDVRLMVPLNSDSRWMRWCMFTYLDKLLASNVKVYLYQGGFLHNKTIVSDDIVASNGTANVDVRSFETNFEINAMVYDKQTAIDLKQHFFEDMEECEELTLESFRNRKDRNKYMESFARLTSPML